MLVVQESIATAAQWDAELELQFNERSKSRLRTRVRDGEEIGLFLARGTVLHDGDCLRADDGRVVKVFASAEALHEARCDDASTLARAAYHLGNRHAHVQVLSGALRFAADQVLAQMLEGIGVSVRPIVAPFEPEPGAYAAGGHPHSGEARHAGRIHDFSAREAGPR